VLAAEGIYAGLKAGSDDLSSYEQAVGDSAIGKDLYQERNTRQPFQGGRLTTPESGDGPLYQNT
jgi:electron-transferring-flavoprotein dehydrogenase